jgi:hypothetical protein
MKLGRLSPNVFKKVTILLLIVLPSNSTALAFPSLANVNAAPSIVLISTPFRVITPCVNANPNAIFWNAEWANARTFAWTFTSKCWFRHSAFDTPSLQQPSLD